MVAFARVLTLNPKECAFSEMLNEQGRGVTYVHIQSRPIAGPGCRFVTGAEIISNLRVIFFDLDGTLTDYERSVDYAMTKIWEIIRDKCPLDLEEFLQGQWDFLAEMEEKESAGEIPRNFLKDRRIRTETFLKRLSPSLIDDFDDAGKTYSRFRREGVRLFSGTKEALSALRKRYALGVITEGNGQTQRAQLTEAGIIDLFEYIVISDEVGLHKPDIALPLKACEIASVSPNEAALVGDRIDWDILPANEAGMLTILSRQQRHYRINEVGCSEAAFIISDFHELLKILL
ncbi:HAD family hydrolase [bacterium]|nr:HAD family hydrolase [bacterium]